MDGTIDKIFQDFDSDSDRIQDCGVENKATEVLQLDSTSLSIKHFGGVLSIHAIVILVSILYTMCTKKRRNRSNCLHQSSVA
jgi:hypothetical protein